LLERPAILINGMHHPRELTTLSMCVYTYLKLLFKYVHNDPETVYLLKNTAIFIIPIVNFDGY
jgi:murein tripeptide amidase MpaA